MARASCILLLLALAGCAGIPGAERTASACDSGEASYACQVERYHNVSEP